MTRIAAKRAINRVQRIFFAVLLSLAVIGFYSATILVASGVSSPAFAFFVSSPQFHLPIITPPPPPRPPPPPPLIFITPPPLDNSPTVVTPAPAKPPCTDDQQKHYRDLVTKACGQKSKCSVDDKADTIVQKIANSSKCIDARRTEMKQCSQSAPVDGHDQQITDKLTLIKECKAQKNFQADESQ